VNDHVKELYEKRAMSILATTNHRESEIILAKNNDEFKGVLQTNSTSEGVSGKYCNTSSPHYQEKNRQIIRNLISNVFKYRKREMKLSIERHPLDTQVQ
jgi:hypothetical protein